MEQSPSGCGKACAGHDLGPWGASLLSSSLSLGVGKSGTSESWDLGPWNHSEAPRAEVQNDPTDLQHAAITKKVDIESFKLVQPLPGHSVSGKRAKAGKNEVKIQKLWEGPGKCVRGCKHMRETGLPCHRQVTLATWVAVKSAIWSITAEQRAHTFSTLYADAVGASKASEPEDEEQPHLL